MHMQINISYLWSVRNFEHGPSANEFFRSSSTFSSQKGDSSSKWQLILYPNGRRSEQVGQLGLFLKLLVSWQHNVSVTARFTILSVNDQPFCNRTVHAKFNVGEEWGFGDFVERQSIFDNAATLFDHGSLKIACDMTYVAARLHGIKRLRHSASQFWRLLTRQTSRQASHTSALSS